jgi:hypothetical protein
VADEFTLFSVSAKHSYTGEPLELSIVNSSKWIGIPLEELQVRKLLLMVM